jgi:large subunit ribosomal protein L30
MAKAKTIKKAGPRLKITQIRSGIGFDKKHTVILRGLGLRRIRHTVEVPDTAGIRGMLHKVRHLIAVAASSAAPGKEGQN